MEPNPRHRIRHKKCSESRPACHQCVSTGRKCDFDVAPPVPPIAGPHDNGIFPLPATVRASMLGLAPHMHDLCASEAGYFEYFRYVCTRDIALFFEDQTWSNLVLTKSLAEPSIYHAAMATAVLSRNHYAPSMPSLSALNALSATEYANLQYNLAIRALNTKLDSSNASAELAVIGSILFVNIEFLRGSATDFGNGSLIEVHITGGMRILRQLTALGNQCQYLRNALYQTYMQYSWNGRGGLLEWT
ncbi:hypothetical protein S40293_07266 [Stachybotrys chartarum IBT 40293]|nr:hypothetical protein S40293_07266 [Stachybotrys chartarum IBT 40293]